MEMLDKDGKESWRHELPGPSGKMQRRALMEVFSHLRSPASATDTRKSNAGPGRRTHRGHQTLRVLAIPSASLTCIKPLHNALSRQGIEKSKIFLRSAKGKIKFTKAF